MQPLLRIQRLLYSVNFETASKLDRAESADTNQ